jgi:crossover junction endodeoxyribonuclease RuvC
MKTTKSSPVASERIILGIDPGTTVMGYGVLHVDAGRVRLVEAGAVRFTPTDDHTRKLKAIFDSTAEIIGRCAPRELAIEAQFFGKNVQSMLKLGRAQGVAIAAALQGGLTVVEYAPMRVKQSITGSGSASKQQVAAMLASILGVKDLPTSTDATDAVAVALCHYFAAGALPRPSTRGTAKGTSDWGSFIRNNPDRVKGS